MPITVGTSLAGDIDVAGKRLHFRVPLSSNETYLFATTANPNDTPGALDTALTVFDDQGTTVLASTDDAFPRSGSDSQLFFRPSQSGSFCVRVEDFSTWKGNTPVLPSPAHFTLRIERGGALGVVADTEPNDTGSGQALPTGLVASFVGGAFTSPADVDVFTFTMPTGATLLNVELPPNGDPVGPGLVSYGSTLARLQISVQNGAGTTLASLGPPAPVSATPPGLSVPVSGGAYRVVLSRPVGTSPGANDFYGTIISGSEDQVAETELLSTTSNNSKTAAETLTMMTSTTDPKVRNAAWRGYLPAGDAVDYFKFTTSTVSNTLGLNCLAGREGSGLIGFTVSVYGPSSTPIRTEVETPQADLFWVGGTAGTMPLLTLPTASTYYVALSTTSTSTANTGRYYRCSIEVVRP